jgi:hypothetical protein
MLKENEKQVFPKVQKSKESLEEAVRLFEAFLADNAMASGGDYYRARNLLKEGENFYHSALQNARKLLGEVPEYATEEFRKWRAEFLKKHKILIQTEELESCRMELKHDVFINQMMDPEELDALLNLHFVSQSQGKRKLAHLKVRITLDKLSELLIHARELQKQALIKQKQAL